jgi:UDP-glucose 4-epimerase
MMSVFPILVTGGAGYIGSHAVLALQECGWPIVIIDDLSTGHRSRVPAGVPLYEHSIADRVQVETIVRDHSIGAIMHFAGSIVVPESVEGRWITTATIRLPPTV